MFKDELKRLRISKHISQKKLAHDLGFSTSAIGMYENGRREPKDIATLQKIADYFEVNVDVLTGASSITPLRIPVLGKVIAGTPIEAIQDIIGYEEIPSQMAKSGDYFALQIKGDSMEPKFSEGDVVIVRKQEDIESGEIAIVLIGNEDATIKKIKKFSGGISLVPLNITYDVMTYTNEEILNIPITILGKVVELRAKF